MKVSVFIGTSLDGYIAREDGGVDWLSTGGGDGSEDYGYHEFIASVDYLVMGRYTFETVLGFEAWPYAGTPVVVLSSRPLEIPPALADETEHMSGSPLEVVRRLEARGARHLYVDGGRTIQRFLADGLIQELTITTVPVLLGRGIPLFGPLPGDRRLRLLQTRSYPSGLVQTRYEVVP